MAMGLPQAMLEDYLMSKSVMDQPRTPVQRVLDAIFGRTAPERMTGFATGVGGPALGTVLPMNRGAMKFVEEAEETLSKRAPEVLKYVSDNPKIVKLFQRSAEDMNKESYGAYGLFNPKKYEASFISSSEIPGKGFAELGLEGVSPEAQLIMHEGYAHPAQYMSGINRWGHELHGKPFPGLDWNYDYPKVAELMRPYTDSITKRTFPNSLFMEFGLFPEQEVLPRWFHNSPSVRVVDEALLRAALKKYFGVAGGK